MRISHICLGCGQDLAMVRAVREGRYGLHIAVCPSCGLAHARRPFWLERRRVRRLILACRTLWAQFMVGATLLGASAGLTAFLASRMRDLSVAAPDAVAAWLGVGSERLRDESTRADVFALAASTAIFVLAGVWIGLALRHWRPWVAGLCWLTLVAGTVSIEAGVLSACDVAARAAGESGPGSAAAVREWALRMQALAIGTFPLALGAGVGALAARGDAGRQSARWRMRLGRARRKRRIR